MAIPDYEYEDWVDVSNAAQTNLELQTAFVINKMKEMGFAFSETSFSQEMFDTLMRAYSSDFHTSAMIMKMQEIRDAVLDLNDTIRERGS